MALNRFNAFGLIPELDLAKDLKSLHERMMPDTLVTAMKPERSLVACVKPPTPVSDLVKNRHSSQNSCSWASRAMDAASPLGHQSRYSAGIIMVDGRRDP